MKYWKITADLCGILMTAALAINVGAGSRASTKVQLIAPLIP